MLTWCFVGAFLLITSPHMVDDLTTTTHRTPSRGRLLPSPKPKDATRPPSAWLPPRTTRVEKNGRITVVDVGLSVASLAHEFAHQRAEAAAAAETLLIMTTATACDPCRGVDEALRDPRLQSALGHVRLVRVGLSLRGRSRRASRSNGSAPRLFPVGVGSHAAGRHRRRRVGRRRCGQHRAGLRRVRAQPVRRSPAGVSSSASSPDHAVAPRIRHGLHPRRLRRTTAAGTSHNSRGRHRAEPLTPKPLTRGDSSFLESGGYPLDTRRRAPSSNRRLCPPGAALLDGFAKPWSV